MQISIQLGAALRTSRHATPSPVSTQSLPGLTRQSIRFAKRSYEE